jgi:hypothetical protein
VSRDDSPAALSKLTQEGAMHSLVDFDEHFECVQKDWRNSTLNSIITMAAETL